MLRNVLADYLNSIKERDFDLPFLSLLPALGFYDVHFTHGQLEYGKDFIAKRLDEGIETQYTFQTKAGDIGQSEWREIRYQMLEAVMNTLSHPNFDTNIPRKAILVTTGLLKGNAALDFQNLNQELQSKYNVLPILFWGKEQLIEYLEKYGLSGIYGATASKFINYGNFYRIYGKSLQGHISDREIERYTEQWLEESLGKGVRIRLAAIEGEIIAGQCINKGFIYEAIRVYQGIVRTILYEMQDAATVDPQLIEVYQQAMVKVLLSCKQFVSDFQEAWLAANKDLVAVPHGPSVMMTYLVQCTRALEVTGFLYFLAKETGETIIQTQAINFLQDFIIKEPGCGHIPGDRYAVSLIFPTLALLNNGNLDQACNFIHQSVVWLCDRYEEGFGIASVEADELMETKILLGYAFDFINLEHHPGCLAATVLCDLAAFTGNAQLYEAVVNDIKAVQIIPIYWQSPDTKSLYRIDAEDVIGYGNVPYSDTFLPFTTYQFAHHIKEEPDTYKVAQSLGPLSLMTVMLILRDRYFPKLWPLLNK